MDPTVPELSSGIADAGYEFVESDTWEYSVARTGSTRELTLEVTAVDGEEATLSQTFVDGAFALYLNRTTSEGLQVSEWELTGRSR